MSRVGKRVIDIPSGVTVDIDGSTITVKGPKGELVNTFNEEMTFKQEENTLEVVRPSDSKEHRTVHGTTRSLINNMVVGVSDGFRSEEHTSELQSRGHLVCRLLLEKKNQSMAVCCISIETPVTE